MSGILGRRLAAAALCVSAACASAAERLELWFYYPVNLQVAANVDALEQVWRRAAGAGYTHVLLTDSKFARLGELGSMEQPYFANVARVKRLAEALKLELVPAVYRLGWSNDMLWHNPSLAEGLPVKEAPFVVRDGAAVPANEPAVSLGAPDWADPAVRVEGAAAAVVDAAGNARLAFTRALPKFRCYRLSVGVRTEAFSGTPEIKVLADGRSLQWQSAGVKRTQALTRHDVVFNTLDHEKVTIYFGAWGGGKGRLEWREWRLEEAGLVNVLRRPGAPLTVVREDGQACVEGRDFEPVSDPKLGAVPYKGEYEAWHEPPRLRTRLPEGTRLRVSWYHPAIIYGGAVMACVSEPQTDALLQDEARRVRAAWDARRYLMAHDEIRTFNWDAACAGQGLDAGALLAAQVRRCTGWLAGARVYVWSDMFDPHHNARDGYYLVRGDLRGSWEGLDPAVTVVNWNFDQREASLRFFAGRGHRQILAGYYDAPVEQVGLWLDAAAGVRGVEGVMYTTWRNDYRQLEAFAARVRQHASQRGPAPAGAGAAP